MIKKFARALETYDVVTKGTVFRDGDDRFKITSIDSVEVLSRTVVVKFWAKQMTDKRVRHHE